MQPIYRGLKARFPTLSANKITTARLFLALWSWLLFAQGQIIAAVTVFLITAFLDSFDGGFARANQENASRFGRIYDPAVDKAINLSWLWFFVYQSVFSSTTGWLMTVPEAMSTAIYAVTWRTTPGANKCGGAKKVTQDSSLILAMLDLPLVANLAMHLSIIFAGCSLFYKIFGQPTQGVKQAPKIAP